MTDRDEELAREFWLGHHPPQNYPFESHDPIKCEHCGPPLIALLKKARREGREEEAREFDKKHVQMKEALIGALKHDAETMRECDLAMKESIIASHKREQRARREGEDSQNEKWMLCLGVTVEECTGGKAGFVVPEIPAEVAKLKYRREGYQEGLKHGKAASQDYVVAHIDGQLVMRELLERAWGIIANSYDGDWTVSEPETPCGKKKAGWVEAASKWRDEYHRTVDDVKGIAFRLKSSGQRQRNEK